MTNKAHHLAHPKYRRDIDGLRAVAILAVIIYHAFPSILPGGFIGVDIFFVISGFLISTIIFSSLERDRYSLAEFYVRRVRRIFPALVVVLLACVAFGRFVLPVDQYQQLGKHAAASAGFVQNFVLWNESGYFDAAAQAKPLLHLWSLAVEEQFYIFWPLLLAVVWKRHWGFLRITAVIAVLSFAANIYLVDDNAAAAFYLPVSRFWELMLGGVLAFVLLHHPQWLAKYRNLQSLLGFLLVALGLVFLNEARDFPGWWALLPTVGAFLILSAEGSWLNERLLANKAMVWIGLISYPLYLWHWPLLSYLRIVDVEISPLVGIGALGVAAGLAWLTYEFVEKPFRFGASPRGKTAILVGALAVTGLTGVYALSWSELTGDKPAGTAIATSWPGEVIPASASSHASVTAGPPQSPVTKYDFASNYRLGQCFLDGRVKRRYAEICDGDLLAASTVVIWGDSHAASLFRGLLKQSQIKGFNLAQYNTSGCPPVLEFVVDNRKGCVDLNAFVLDKISKIKPDTVVLAAYWLLYDGKHAESGKPWNRLPEDQLEKTLQVLKSLGVDNIVVVGQVPTFVKSQVHIGLAEFVPNAVNRTYSGYVHESGSADDRIRRVAADSDVSFVSPIDTLCDKAGCLISTSLQSFIPLAWDYGHFTTEGSEFFVESAIRNKSLSLN